MCSSDLDPPVVKPSTIGAGTGDRCILASYRLIFYSLMSYKSGSQILWNSNIQKNPPSVAFEDVMKDDRDVLKWLEKIVSLHFPPIQRFSCNPPFLEPVWLLLRLRRSYHHQSHS